MSATDAAVKLVEESLAEKNAELESKVGPLAAEIKELEAFLKKITRGSKTATGAPATSDEDLIAAVAHVSKSGPAKSPDVAKFLGVDPRTISRRLSAFAADPEKAVSGDKNAGYTA